MLGKPSTVELDTTAEDVEVSDEKAKKEPYDELDSEPQEPQEAKGKNKGEGMFDYEINKIMEPLKEKGYMGTISSDEIPKLIPKASKRMSFVMNLDPANKPGSHWVAVYIDARDKGSQSVEYYDSYGDEPSKQFKQDIKKLIDAISPPIFLKFKINRIKQQRVNSDNCGWFAIKFLVDRYKGIQFKESSGFSETMKAEEDIKQFKKKFKEFDFI
jgi:hypothetical protein